MRAAQRPAPTLRADFKADDITNVDSCCSAARAWSSTIPERKRQQAAWAFVKAAIDEYVGLLARQLGRPIRIGHPPVAMTFTLDTNVRQIARALGRQTFELPLEQACFRLGATYPAMLPASTRGKLGMYYTPPALTKRLLDIAEEAGIEWQTARVLDPACGGGAFLLPIAIRMRQAMSQLPNSKQLENIFGRLRGFEIDPFAAWLTETWLQIAFADMLEGKRLPSVVELCDTLEQEPGESLFDLVVGNPPYGRVSLTDDQRQRFKRSLFGHANLYGVFTDIALRWATPGGVIALVTPTSFLAGEYFKSLRSLLAEDAPPIAIDFIHARKGIFEDVLQEALLAAYRKDASAKRARVHHLDVSSDSVGAITHTGSFVVPKNAEAPWIVPRTPEYQAFVDRMASMRTRLHDWGYQVSTGPLVWNRFKSQLRARPGRNVFPLIWAEAIAGPGRFIHRAERRNHQPFFFTRSRDAWLKIGGACILVQRTTAKEQSRRLIAAELPHSFVKRHGAVVIENHLNMIKPIAKQKPKVSPATVAAFMNSVVADEVFRCINGSVAVSAFELEAMPLPAVTEMRSIERLVAKGECLTVIDAQIRALYLGSRHAS